MSQPVWENYPTPPLATPRGAIYRSIDATATWMGELGPESPSDRTWLTEAFHEPKPTPIRDVLIAVAKALSRLPLIGDGYAEWVVWLDRGRTKHKLRPEPDGPMPRLANPIKSAKVIKTRLAHVRPSDLR